MSANVETMMSVRTTPWHGLGNILEDAPTSKEAIKQAGLDWRVVSSPLMLENGILVPNYVANVRESDNSVFGIVTGKYQILQNMEAFDFMDSLSTTGDVKYETAGSLQGGKKVWMLARVADNFKILDDEYEGYMLLSNSHDGKGSIRVNVTPIRVVCQNTLNLALKTTKRSWSTRHMGKMEAKVSQASNTLGLYNSYIAELDKEAQILASKKVSQKDFNKILDFIIPMPEDMSNRQKNNASAMRDEISSIYNFTPDIANFKGTAWGVVNAITDFVGHTQPQRNAPTFEERRFQQVVEGHKLLDQTTDLLMAI